ncbi:MAG: tetratricopeptide repeat protein [Candidatus Hydrogenedentes bacterium]|nr:tetratricopeptide repeat protein [Candidatus Hydrogenedentota bacterium]
MDEKDQKEMKERQLVEESKQKLLNILENTEKQSPYTPQENKQTEENVVQYEPVINQTSSKSEEETSPPLPEIPSHSTVSEKTSEDFETVEIIKEIEDRVISPPKKEDAEVALLTQEEVEQLIKLAQQEEKEKQKRKQEALEKLDITPPTEQEEAKKITETSKKSRTLDKKNLIPLLLSVILGLTVGLLTYSYLQKNKVDIPERIIPTYLTNLASAIEYANMLISEGRYSESSSVIGEVLKSNPAESEEKITLKYLLIKSKFLSGSLVPGTEDFQNTISYIDEVVGEAPKHPLAPLALFYKGKLYELDNFPYPAIETYERIIQNYPEFEKRDETLISLSNLELLQNNPVKSSQWAQQLIREFPSSTYKTQALFNIAESYRITGLQEDARTIFVRLTESDPNNPLASLASVRVAQMAIEQGKYEQAIVQLKTKTELIKSFEYNDEAYYLLGKALYHLGRLEEAMNTLRDLIVFFPPSETHPKAWIELSQILYSMGKTDEAFQTADEALRRYPNNPQVIANKADFLALRGNSYASAIAYLEAEAKGGKNPQYLLRAGKYLNASKEYDEAIKVFDELKKRYYGTKEALWGNIEKVKCLISLKRINSALTELERLKALTTNKPQEKTEVLKLLFNIYNDLKLTAKAEEVGSHLLDLLDSDEEKADLLSSMIAFTNIDKLRKLISTIDLSKIPKSYVYSLLLKYAEKMLTFDPPEGITILEQLYFQYPDLIDTNLRRLLFDAYIKTDRYTPALRIIKDWEYQLLDKEEERKALIDAEIAWGDYNYKKGDKASASQAYQTAITLANIEGKFLNGEKFSIDWAKLQYAIILIEDLNLEEGVKILEEVSKGEIPYSDIAKLRLKQINLEKSTL